MKISKHSKTWSNIKPNKSHCTGCHDNFYNGNNNVGVDECMSFPTAKLVLRKRVHINDVPPWTGESIEIPDCYHEPQYVFVDPSREY